MSLLWVTFTASFCSMCFSMIMALVMTEFTGEEVLTQCLTVGPYLLGLGAGSALADRIRNEFLRKRLFQLEWASVVALPVVPILQLLAVFLFIHFSPVGTTLEGRGALQFLLSVTGVLSFCSGILGGAQLPIILNVSKGFSEEVILAVNYLGPLAAGILIVALAGSGIPMALQLFIVGCVQISGLLALVLPEKNRTRSLAFLFLPLLTLVGVGHAYPKLEHYTVKSSYLRTKADLRDLFSPGDLLRVIGSYAELERVRTPYQTIDLLIEPPDLSYGIPGNATVYLNRKPQFDLLTSATYHQSMVWAGMNLLRRRPESVLILGAGDGLLLNELSQLKLPSVTMIELDQTMLEWSRTNPVISNLNRGALDHIPPGTRVITGDAVSFLRQNRGEKFDLIFIDFPFPNGHELAKLYSFEFYTMVRRSLSDDGLVVVDLPLYRDQGRVLAKDSRIIIKTMKAAGFPHPLLFGPLASFIAMGPSDQPLSFDYQTIPKDLSVAAAANFLSSFREDEISAEEWARVQVNTMFWPGEL